jgi:hypothetical protein
MVVAALFVLGIPLILVALLAVAFVVVAVANMGWALALFMPLVVVGGAALLLYCVDRVKRLVLANNAQECWDPAHEDPAVAESMAI